MTRPEVLNDELEFTLCTGLVLHGNNFTSFPLEIGLFSNLTRLEFENNKLTALPELVTQLKKLKYLNLGDNNIKELPQNIGNLSQLKLFILLIIPYKPCPMTCRP